MSGPNGRDTAWYRDLVEQAPDGMVVLNPEGCIVLVNRAMEELFGYDRSELVGRHVEVLVPERLRNAHRHHRNRFGRSGGRRPMGAALKLSGRRSDGGEFPVEISLATTSDGPWAGFVAATVRDVTVKRAGEEALRTAEARFRNTFQFSGVGMALSEQAPDGSTRIIECNEALAELLGCQTSQLLGRSFADLHVGDGAATATRAVSDLMSARELRVQYDSALRYGAGSEAWAHVTSSVIAEDPGEHRQFVHHILDLRDRRQLETELRFLADHDELTGLLNRRRFLEELERVILHATRYQRPWAVLLIDLDNFKHVNDTLGHLTGDQMIARSAATLKRRVRATDRVGRLGGDEFAVVLVETSREQAEDVAQDLVNALRAVHVMRGEDIIRATASIGIATVQPGQPVLPQSILHNADVAMFAAKRSGGDRAAFFDATCLDAALASPLT